MGVDKARLPSPDGWTWAVHVAGVLAAVCHRVSIVRREPLDDGPWRTPPGLQVDIVMESAQRPRHALSGVVTACEHSETPLLMLAPCDLIGITEDAVRRLHDTVRHGSLAGEATPLSDASGAVVSAQPLFAVVPKALAPLALAAARRGDSVRSFFAAAQRVDVGEDAVRHVNSWSDTGWPHPLDRLRALGLDAAAIDAERARCTAWGVVLPPEPGSSGY